MSMTLKTTKNLCFGLSVVFKITTRRSTIDVRKKSDLSRKNRTTGPNGHVRKISDQPQPGHTRMPDHVITAEAMMWKWPEMNFYAGELRVKMRYSVFHTQLHHDSRQVYRNLDVSCTIVEILWLAKCLVWRKLGREVTKRRGVSKCRPVLWSSSGRRAPACIHGFLLSSPISIVQSDVPCLLRPSERFVYDMHSHK